MASTVPSIAPPADRRAALDRAHLGDIEGAIGTLRSDDTAPRRTLHRRLMTLLAVAGSGLIVMAADNDAGTMTVFGQAGHGYGTRAAWTIGSRPVPPSTARPGVAPSASILAATRAPSE